MYAINPVFFMYFFFTVWTVDTDIASVKYIQFDVKSEKVIILNPHFDLAN